MTRFTSKVTAFYGVQRYPDVTTLSQIKELPDDAYVFIHDYGDWFQMWRGSMLRRNFDELPKEIQAWALILNLQERP